MQPFYMLAGTVMSDSGLEQLKALLSGFDIQSTIEDDELELEGQSHLVFRSGFDHEYIVVADAVDKNSLLDEVGSLSGILSRMQIQHEFEIYDKENSLIESFSFLP